MPARFDLLASNIKSKLSDLTKTTHFSAHSNLYSSLKIYPKAAILIPICIYNNKPSILFTKRPLKLRNHAGQVSFPGGKVDKTDKSEIDTALRELNEEINYPIDGVKILGVLPNHLVHVSNIMVTPIVGKLDCKYMSLISPNHDEVDSIFYLPLDYLTHPVNRDLHMLCPRFLHPTDASLHIWGFTGTVLNYFLNSVELKL